MSENHIDRIPKLLVPLYEAELQCNEFDTEVENKFELRYDWKTCSRCGSHAFYVKCTEATKETSSLEENLGYSVLVDMEFVCAECGESAGGLIQSEKFSEIINKEKKK